MLVRFVCLPDTVDMRGPKEKNDTMPLLAELEEFVGAHRLDGTLTCDAAEPTSNGTC